MDDEVDGEEVKIRSKYRIENIFSQLNRLEETFEKKIQKARIYLEEVHESVNVSLRFRPEGYSNWSYLLTDFKFGAESEEIDQNELSNKKAVFAGAVTSESPNDQDFNETTFKSMMSDEGFEFEILIEGSASVRKFQAKAQVNKENQEPFQDSDEFNFKAGVTPSDDLETLFDYSIK